MTACMRHFTLDFFTSFDGLNRVLTILVLGKIPESILVRQERSGISRYYITEEFLP